MGKASKVNGSILQALKEQREAGVQNAGMSENSRRNLDTMIRYWQDWCADNGRVDQPAAPESIIEFLYDEAELGRTLGTLRVRLWGISVLHKGSTDPTKTEAVINTLKGIGGLIGRPQEQAAPLDTEALEAIEKTACNRRRRSNGRGEHSTLAHQRGIKDIAIAYLLSDCGLRRSEASALTWADVEDKDGNGLINIRRSKTDQSGEGQSVALTPKGYAALLRYRESCESPIKTLAETDKVIGLSPKQISNRVKVMAKWAGLEGNFSGHSGRVGLAVRAARSGFSAGETMVQGRWKRADTVARYQKGLKSTELVAKLR